jgi:hypothetical protein
MKLVFDDVELDLDVKRYFRKWYWRVYPPTCETYWKISNRGDTCGNCHENIELSSRILMHHKIIWCESCAKKLLNCNKIYFQEAYEK